MADTPYRMPGTPNAPFIAGANLSALQYRFLKPGATEGQVVTMAAATDQPICLLLDKPDAQGKVAETVQFGIYEVEAGAVVAWGALIQSDSVGRAITAVATGYVCGRALQAAGAAGERIACYIWTVNPWLKA